MGAILYDLLKRILTRKIGLLTILQIIKHVMSFAVVIVAMTLPLRVTPMLQGVLGQDWWAIGGSVVINIILAMHVVRKQKKAGKLKADTSKNQPPLVRLTLYPTLIGATPAVWILFQLKWLQLPHHEDMLFLGWAFGVISVVSCVRLYLDVADAQRLRISKKYSGMPRICEILATYDDGTVTVKVKQLKADVSELIAFGVFRHFPKEEIAYFPEMEGMLLQVDEKDYNALLGDGGSLRRFLFICVMLCEIA